MKKASLHLITYDEITSAVQLAKLSRCIWRNLAITDAKVPIASGERPGACIHLLHHPWAGQPVSGSIAYECIPDVLTRARLQVPTAEDALRFAVQHRTAIKSGTPVLFPHTPIADADGDPAVIVLLERTGYLEIHLTTAAGLIPPEYLIAGVDIT